MTIHLLEYSCTTHRPQAYLSNLMKQPTEKKTATHTEYDEAHYTTSHKPMCAVHLINVGYHKPTNIDSTNITPNPQDSDTLPSPTISPSTLQVKALSDKATIPVKASEGSAGYDIFSSEDVTIQPGNIQLVKTDIAIICPPGTYGRIAPRSGLTVKQRLDIRAGVTDNDYIGHVLVAMHNIGDEPQSLPAG